MVKIGAKLPKLTPTIKLGIRFLAINLKNDFFSHTLTVTLLSPPATMLQVATVSSIPG